ncbi:CAZyme family GH28 [Paecilomyces variotii]|nr:CAZyme family GH28 [Paecilomyces variotii]KAJ9231185.1 CAZyme family GH28 [Paecilomyces variotii]KAJ9236499.1 CAZyme family GH28 [Paecilomyces variotii]KAJ9256406.1 CAZyme family GH28 [Paecilomyces variotii]
MHYYSLASWLCLATAGAAVVSASPAPTRVDRRASSCTFTDAAAATESKASCSTITLKDIEVPAGKTLDLTDLNEGTKVIFSGETTFGYAEWSGPLISISGTNIAVSGEPSSVLNGNGSRWWDGKGSNGGVTKPKFFYAHHLDSSTISGITIKNSPVHVFSIQSDGLVLRDVTIDNSDGDTQGGHNTDAFDVGESTGVEIVNAVVRNQDDCLAVNSGENILFSNGTCSGGHGLSIGSVGGRDDNTVKNVTIQDSSISNSQNGVRIKTVYDATGSVSQVTYSNIKLSNITDYGIVIEQDYENGSPTGEPTNGVSITDLTIDGVTGSVADDATPIYILCGDGSCEDWTWEGVDITGGKESDACENVPDGASC